MHKKYAFLWVWAFCAVAVIRVTGVSVTAEAVVSNPNTFPQESRIAASEMVTHGAGQVYRDASLPFSDAIAGNNNPGSTLYADGAIQRLESVVLNTGENLIYCAVMDEANGYAYFGTLTSPGRVVKMKINENGGAPIRVGALTVNSGENEFLSAAIDTVNGYAYFGTYTSPGRIVKVRLGEGDAPPVRVGALTLSSGENSAYCMAIDAAGQ